MQRREGVSGESEDTVSVHCFERGTRRNAGKSAGFSGKGCWRNKRDQEIKCNLTSKETPAAISTKNAKI